MSIKWWRATQTMRATESQRAAERATARNADNPAQARIDHLAIDALDSRDQATLGAAALGHIPPVRRTLGDHAMNEPINIRRTIAEILLTHPHNTIDRETLRRMLPTGHKKTNGRNNIGEAYRISLRQFDRAGAIKRDGGLIVILDRDELRVLAASVGPSWRGGTTRHVAE